MAKKATEKKAPVKKAAPKKEAVKLEATKMYDFIVTKESGRMKKGTYTVSGEMCSIFIKKGLGSVRT